MNSKILLISFFLFFLLGCRTDLKVIENKKRIYNKEQVNFSAFKKETNLTSLRERSFDQKIRQKIARGGHKKSFRHFIDEFYIDTVYITKVTLGNNDTYTFNAIRLFDKEEKKYNIIYYKYRDKWEYNIFEVDGKKIIKPIFNSIVGHLYDRKNIKTSRSR